MPSLRTLIVLDLPPGTSAGAELLAPRSDNAHTYFPSTPGEKSRLALPATLIVLFTIGLLLGAAPLRSAEIASGSMLGPRYKPDRFYVRAGRSQWDETYSSGGYKKQARGKLMALHLSQGLFEDEWLTEAAFDPAANTQALIDALDLYKSYGVSAIVVNLQGGDHGYSPDANGIKRNGAAAYGKAGGSLVSAFAADGSLKRAWTSRLEQLLRAADQRGLIVCLVYFEAQQDEALDGPEAIVEAARNVTRWLIEKNFRNVIIDVASGWDVRSEWDHGDFIPRNVASLIRDVREQFNGSAFSLPIGASSGPGMAYPISLARAGDVVLLSDENLEPAQELRRLGLMGDYQRPLWVVDSGRADQPNAGRAEASFRSGAGWTYQPSAGAVFPFRYLPSPSSECGLRKALEQIAGFVLKKPPEIVTGE